MTDERRSFANLGRRAFLALAAAALTVALSFSGATVARAKEQVSPLGVPGVQGGVVTTSEPQAAQAGAAILRRGGNAIDAAAAVQFALNVLEPQSSGIGGGGFMMIHLAKTGETFVVDSRERAPAAAEPEMFLQASDGEPFPFGIRSTSGVAVGVPGTLLGVATSLEKATLDEVLDTPKGPAHRTTFGRRIADSHYYGESTWREGRLVSGRRIVVIASYRHHDGHGGCHHSGCPTH